MAANSGEFLEKFLKEGLLVKAGQRLPSNEDIFNRIKRCIRKDKYDSNDKGHYIWQRELDDISALDDALCFLLQPGRDEKYYELAARMISGKAKNFVTWWQCHISSLPLENRGTLNQSVIELVKSCRAAILKKEAETSGTNRNFHELDKVLAAIENRDKDAIDRHDFLPNGCRFNLLFSVKYNYVPRAIELIKAGTQQKFVSDEGGEITALQLAKQLNLQEIITAIRDYDLEQIKQKSFAPNALLPSGRRFFLALIEDGQENLAIDFIRQGAELKPATDAIDQNWPAQENALHVAVRYGRRKVISYLIAHTEMEQYLDERNEKGLSVIFIAAETDHVGMLLSVLRPDRRMEIINSRLENGMTPLHQAVLSKSRQGCIELLHFGAEVDAKAKDGQTPLHLAVLNDAKEEYITLLAAGADANAQASILEGNSLLHITLNKKNTHGSLALLQAKANIHATTPAGETPLHLALLHNAKEEYIALLAAGANTDAATLENKTPLHISVLNNNRHGCLALLQAGANINAQTFEGETPLHLAIRQDHIRLAWLLLHRGADTTLLDHQNRLALELPNARSLLQKVDNINYEILGKIQQKKDTLIEKNPAFFANQIKVCEQLLHFIHANMQTPSSITIAAFIRKKAYQELQDSFQSISLRAQQIFTAFELQGFDDWLHSLIRPIYQQYLSTASPVFPLLNEPDAAPSRAFIFPSIEPELSARTLKDSGAVLRKRRAEAGLSNSELRAKYDGNCALLPLAVGQINHHSNTLVKDYIYKLLHAGVDPISMDGDNSTVLHSVCNGKEKENSFRIEALHLLLASRAILLINHQTNYGATPFLIATENNNVEMMKILLTHSANPCIANSNGDTALHMAIAFGGIESCIFLLQNGCSLKEKNSKGYTPLHIALNHKKYDIFHLLLLHDADPYEQPLPDGSFVWDSPDGQIKALFQKIRNENATVKQALEIWRDKETSTIDAIKGINQLLSFLETKKNRPYSANLTEFRERHSHYYEAITAPPSCATFTLFQPRSSTPLSTFATPGYRQYFPRGEAPIPITERNFSKPLLFWQQPLMTPPSAPSCSSASAPSASR